MPRKKKVKKLKKIKKNRKAKNEYKNSLLNSNPFNLGAIREAIVRETIRYMAAYLDNIAKDRVIGKRK